MGKLRCRFTCLASRRPLGFLIRRNYELSS
jgi:hypothetical protein